MDYNYRSKSALFLMEQLVVILIFAICAAACVKIFAGSYIMAVNSSDMSGAALAAENGAECFKAVHGDMIQVAGILGGRADGDGAVVFYDEKWRICAEGDADFRMRFSPLHPEDVPESLVCGVVSVEKITGEEIMTLTVAGRKSG